MTDKYMPSIPAEPDDILHDSRPIARLDYDDPIGSAFIANDETTIEAYGEPGEYAGIPWFRVIRGGVVVARVHAEKVTVTYKDTPHA